MYDRWEERALSFGVDAVGRLVKSVEVYYDEIQDRGLRPVRCIALLMILIHNKFASYKDFGSGRCLQLFSAW